MYDFLAGTGLWIAFSVCIGGLLGRLLFLLVFSRRRNPVLYNHVHLGWGIRSIVRWLVPGGSVSMRKQPFFTTVGFTFHILLFAVPLFFHAHNLLWERTFGFALPSMSNGMADLLTGVFILCWLILLGRRFVRPELRVLAGAWDHALMVFILVPFVSGYLAFHQLGNYQAMMLIHVISAEFLLILIPFTKLSHGLLFFVTRAFIGFELGARRGTRPW